MKVVTVIGARPQFIKAGSVSREIIRQQQLGVDIQEIIVHTGQHYDTNMSDVFFEEMQIPKPDYYLGIGGKSHGAMTGQMIEKIEEVLLKEKPDWLLVYGDTNSTLAGAIAASKLHVKIAHVEAGLRSFNMTMPEEVNRILTDRISTLLLCPTRFAMDNLKKESIDNWNSGAKAILVGDVMQDGAIFYKDFAQKPKNLDVDDEFVLCTIHRAENTDDPERLAAIIDSLNEISLNKQIVLPLHPRTQSILAKGQLNTSNLTIIEPVGYLNMVWLISNSSLIMTDSGGLQKEAYFFGKRCITLRDETEWIELVDAGVNVLVGANKINILNAFNTCYEDDSNLFKAGLYGDGMASNKVINGLLNFKDKS